MLNLTHLARDLTPQFCSALLSVHAFTGCDSTSAFKGKGKVKALKLLQQRLKFVPVFESLGESWSVTEQQLDELEEFVCLLYGRQKTKKVDDVRHMALLEKCKGPDGVISPDANIDLATLPPCRRSLKQHALRSNYQVAIWKLADIPCPDVPDPTTGHGWKKDDGVLLPVWTKEEDELVLPQAVIDDIASDAFQEGDEDDFDMDTEHLFQESFEDFTYSESDTDSEDD